MAGAERQLGPDEEWLLEGAVKRKKGRTLYYEGDDPEGFRQDMIQRFGFDPAASPGDDRRGLVTTPVVLGGPGSVPTWNEEWGYAFWAPEYVEDVIYGDPQHRWALGS